MALLEKSTTKKLWVKLFVTDLPLNARIQGSTSAPSQQPILGLGIASLLLGNGSPFIAFLPHTQYTRFIPPSITLHHAMHPTNPYVWYVAHYALDLGHLVTSGALPLPLPLPLPQG